MKQTRWTWQILLVLAIILFALLFGIDLGAKLILFPGTSATAINLRAAIRFTYAVIVGGIAYYGLGGTRLLNRLPSMTKFLKIMMTVIGVLLGLLLLISNFPYRVILMSHSNLFLANTLVALSAGIFEEFTCRGLLLSTFATTFKFSKYQYTWAAIVSSGCFGLLHLFNIIAGQGLMITIQQAIYAFILGILFVTIRLTTNSLTWVIVIHFFIDWQPAIASHVMTGAGSPWGPFLMIWLPVLIVGLIYMIGFDRNVWRHAGLSFF
ncbi:CPBP family intramembrane glutamic endopeptidase [Lentilactobacillus raoultii]|uniref:CPBP family intramembrane glutamic endopeptidase n=1 Tax=Lentilactobacillus raoultii TaxID=1987503 RepID=A0ABW3PK48_9LACO|nr:CPBP family intramembrane glutamic endopeptidase [Lentilactobacillus raoultii]